MFLCFCITPYCFNRTVETLRATSLHTTTPCGFIAPKCHALGMAHRALTVKVHHTASTSTILLSVFTLLSSIFTLLTLMFRLLALMFMLLASVFIIQRQRSHFCRQYSRFYCQAPRLKHDTFLQKHNFFKIIYNPKTFYYG